MKNETTIIYLTDNKLEDRIFKACKHHLLVATEGKRLLTVSQKPLDFGENICVGDIGSSGLSIELQIKAGLEETKTKFIAIAEHDCVYSKEHFDWIPPDEKYFYYNGNQRFLQYESPGHPEWNGLFSLRKERLVQSQLIVGRDIMLEATEQKIDILSDPKVKNAWPGNARLGEPGIYDVLRVYKIFKRRHLLNVWEKVKKYTGMYTAKKFSTIIPNIDIRHGGNLTGAMRGYRRCWNLEHWGTMEDILNV